MAVYCNLWLAVCNTIVEDLKINKIILQVMIIDLDRVEL